MKEKSVRNKKTAFILDRVRYWSFLNLGILLMAAGIYFFKTPNGFATGGVSGISIILAKLFPVISQATFMLAINLLLLLIGWVLSWVFLVTLKTPGTSAHQPALGFTGPGPGAPGSPRPPAQPLCVSRSPGGGWALARCGLWWTILRKEGPPHRGVMTQGCF